MEKKIIDWDLAIELASGNKDFAYEMFTTLFDEIPEIITKLENAFCSNDLVSIEKTAHKLHGATCYTGTPRLKDAAKNLEITSAQKANINAEYQKLITEINNFKSEFVKIS